MNYLHYELDLGPRELVRVNLDKAANVRLLDSSNYQRYRDNREHRYYGGYVKATPYDLAPPYPGHWHLVVDLGGYPGTVRASVSTIKG